MRRSPEYTPDPLEVELLGPMLRCYHCHEWWPADSEFFHWRKSKQRYDGVCRACRNERRCQREAEKRRGPVGR